MLQQEVGFDTASIYCGDDWRACAEAAEPLVGVLVAAWICLAATPSILRGVLKLVRDDPEAAEWMGVPARWERTYLAALGGLSATALFWAVAPLLGDSRLLLNATMPGHWAALTLGLGAFLIGPVFVHALVRRTLGRRFGLGFASQLPAAAAVGVLLSLVFTDSLAAGPLFGFTLAGLGVGALTLMTANPTWAAIRWGVLPLAGLIALRPFGEILLGAVEAADLLRRPLLQ